MRGRDERHAAASYSCNYLIIVLQLLNIDYGGCFGSRFPFVGSEMCLRAFRALWKTELG